MSMMQEKPVYTLLEFRVRDDKNFGECAWAAMLEHCMFGDGFEENINKALKRMWNAGGVAEAKGHRYYVFQYLNPLLKIDKENLDYECL